MPRVRGVSCWVPLPSPAGMRGELRRKASPGLGIAPDLMIDFKVFRHVNVSGAHGIALA